ncbi:Protein of unknown function [Chryseobacterium taihuense]|uniref:DUF2971 domain-containing protein n=2 Tax=Chryseobacterium taihuense TaxID=1141221 RepID=A0ABY0QRM5_9FLAO|nr:Protein of unknown function [Chryseobacterium taihuense]
MFKNLPSILYKYRDWGNNYHKKIIIENQIFLSSQDGFNDPFDATIPFRYDESQLTPENIFKKLYESGKEFMPHLTDAELIDECYKQQHSGIFENGTYWKNYYNEYVENVNKNFGILSLTTKNDNLLMWSHYANCHRGFCIGFNSIKLFNLILGSLGPVVYSDEMPNVPLFDKSGIEGITRLLNTKSLDWAYEEEYRIIKSFAANMAFTFEDETIVENVVLGLKMPDKCKEEVISLLRSKFPQTKIYEATKDLERFKLNIIPIL